MSSFSAHIQQAFEKIGIDSRQRLIVAVSGGADSMALLHCCHVLNYECVVAHVNYGLRGAESDEDEICVRNFCAASTIPIEILHVRDEHWSQHDGSTQEAARSIRYAWFDALLEKHDASFILTAHHANDQVETMLLQFIRGGGGKSLYGMPMRNGSIARPMLALTKKDILEYVAENDTPWRHDASNDAIDYTRNTIRHQLIPSIEQLNPTIHSGIQQRSEWMHQEQAAVDRAVNAFLSRHLSFAHGAETIAVSALRESEFPDVVLWKWLHSKGYSSQQVVQISAHLKRDTSTEPSLFSSASHDVYIQNGTMACVAREEMVKEVIHTLPWSNADMHIDICSRAEVSFVSDGTRQYVDASRITWPLVIRVWQPGDEFHPLGAPGRQKVSDYLTHAKVPSWLKKKARVVESNNTIVSVLGMRICENFKIYPHSEECIRIQFFTERNLSAE